MPKFSTLTLGEKLMYVRKSKGLSQENVAHALKLDITLIGRIERGQRECDEETLAAYKKFLEIENAPLLAPELTLYQDRLWIWNDLLNANRIHDAKQMQAVLSCIQGLPYENDLNMLFLMLETKLLYKESDFAGAKDRLNKVETTLDDSCSGVKHLFYRNKGFLYIFTSADRENAIKYFLLALDYESAHLKADVGLLASIGSLLFDQSRYYHALFMLKQAKAQYNDDGVNALGPILDLNLSFCYIYIGEYSKAKKVLEATLKRAMVINDNLTIGVSLYCLGNISRRTGDAANALKLCNQALTHLEQCTSADKVGYHLFCLTHKIDALIQLKDFAQATTVINHGLELAAGQNELHAINFECRKHIMSIKDSSSASYLENTAIPYFAKTNPAAAIEICDILEEHYNKKNSKMKALTMAAISRDLYKTMFICPNDDKHSPL